MPFIRMILAVDVQYGEDAAVVAGVLFETWESAESRQDYISTVTPIAPYEPGHFYKRELPCILQLLTEHNLTPTCIIVDGYVFLDGTTRPGLGKYLFDTLGEDIPIIGVAKRRFKGIDTAYGILRGESLTPLYVTSVGIEVMDAQRFVHSMHGRYRIPTLLKRVDQLCRGLL